MQFRNGDCIGVGRDSLKKNPIDWLIVIGSRDCIPVGGGWRMVEVSFGEGNICCHLHGTEGSTQIRTCKIAGAYLCHEILGKLARNWQPQLPPILPLSRLDQSYVLSYLTLIAALLFLPLQLSSPFPHHNSSTG